MNGEPPSTNTDAVTAQATPPPTKALAKKKFRWRPALIVVGALLLVFVIVPRAFHAWHTWAFATSSSLRLVSNSSTLATLVARSFLEHSNSA